MPSSALSSLQQLLQLLIENADIWWLPLLQATRGDRQPSFSQADLEMTFSDQEVIMQLTEDLLRAVFSKARPAATPHRRALWCHYTGWSNGRFQFINPTCMFSICCWLLQAAAVG